jgi:glutamate--cysteine ligase
LSAPPESDLSAAVESIDQLVNYFRAGEKPPERWRVGTEHEKIGLYSGSWTPVPYEGKRGIGALLRRIADTEGWEPVDEGGHPIALARGEASITLEPGGQFELSGAPLRTIHETCDEFHSHLALMERANDGFDIAWLGLGINPLYGVVDVPVMPKERYRIMRAYLPSHGSMSLEMMFTTATVQANFDYASEADMVEKMRVALAASPVVSAIFANSSLSEGKANGFVSRRMHIWQHTDPDRTGMLAMAYDEDFGYRRYIEWALDVPMFFVVRGGEYRPANGITFRSFIEAGCGAERATLKDFERHLTTLFPEVRLKRFLEMRGADAVPPGLTCSLPALWKGLLYDAESRAAAWDRVRIHPLAAREAARADVARRGLAARDGEEPMLDLARDLAQLARDGLRRIRHAGRRDPDETGFLDPVFQQLEQGRSPGQGVVDRWEGDWHRSVDRLIEYARY